MTVVMIIPTGIGCKIGGHAGDATPVAKLLASVCDELIVHPNVVNAADLNEMPVNSLYVEGSMLDAFLRNEITLRRVKSNRILLVANEPIPYETTNAANAAYHSAGLDVEVGALTTPLKMQGFINADGKADGAITGHEELVARVKDWKFDALAIHTPIDVDKENGEHYCRFGGTNPWGGVEAKLSRFVAQRLRCPVAHAPISSDASKHWGFVSQPRVAAEMISYSNVFSVLKGLHRAPRCGGSLVRSQVDCLVSPDRCWGPPHNACQDAGIPIIFVRENTPAVRAIIPPSSSRRYVYVNNYWEAAGYVAALRNGIMPNSVRAYVDDQR